MVNIKMLAAVSVIALSAFSASAYENVDFTVAAEATVNGVVSIKSYASPRTNSRRGVNPFENDPFFEFFFGPQTPQRRQQEQNKEPQLQQSGLGSGVIITSDGLIVTNNHVIDGAEKLEVTLNDNRTFDAEVIGTDPETDLALIKIDSEELHVIPMGDSESLKVGEWVIAVGNPFGLTSTVTAGIVSAKSRNISSVTGMGKNGIESYIQTDAAVNPGNSGGALVNLNGELVGINAAIYSQTGNYAGNSFAIPISIVKRVVEDLKTYGNVQRAVLGIHYGELTPQLAKEKGITAVSSGLYVGEVVEMSAASEAGFMEGDVITAINGHPTSGKGKFQEEFAKYRPGDEITVSIIRNNKPMELTVALRNSKGNTEIIRVNDVSALGCSFETVDDETLKALNIRSGLRVVNVTDGKFKAAGIRNGFVILDINNVRVTKADDVAKLYKSIMDNSDYDHVMFITGIYPSTARKVYYAVDLSD